jgi:hypothetical protein
MLKNEKVYRGVSVFTFALHICVFLFVVGAGFLPFYENMNFYECFSGFFGEKLAWIQPYLLLAVLGLSCLAAYFAIKRPLHSIFVLLYAGAFFVVAFLPHAFGALASPWFGASALDFEIGFNLFEIVSYVVYFDVAFFIYALIYFFLNLTEKVEPNFE